MQCIHKFDFLFVKTINDYLFIIIIIVTCTTDIRAIAICAFSKRQVLGKIKNLPAFTDFNSQPATFLLLI